MIYHVPVFGTFWIHKRAENSNAIFLSDLWVFLLSGCGWSMAIRLCRIGTIACPLVNITPISASSSEANYFLSVWKMVRMKPFSFSLGVLLVGGKFLR